MKTNGTKIAGGIGSLIMIVGLILGVVYVLTGSVFDGKFIGHILSTSEAPEIMAFASMGVFFTGVIVAMAAMGISQKGLSKAEKKEDSKKWSVFLTGIIIGVIAVIVLSAIAPKSEFGYVAKSTTWYYIILGAEIVAGITMIIGFVRGLKDSKSPLISSHSDSKSSSDEF